MSDAYERERQNNSRLEELSSKVSALRGVTVNIYDNAREQGVIDSSVSLLPSPDPFTRFAHTVNRSLSLSLPSYTSSNARQTERGLLLPLNLDPQFRRAYGPHGTAGQQDGDFQASGHSHRRCDSALLRAQADIFPEIVTCGEEGNRRSWEGV